MAFYHPRGPRKEVPRPPRQVRADALLDPWENKLTPMDEDLGGSDHRGSELWAPILQVVHNGVIMGS